MYIQTPLYFTIIFSVRFTRAAKAAEDDKKCQKTMAARRLKNCPRFTEL
jgi:hypothetical protein